MKGDGSAAKPWSTLAEVLNPANKLIATQSHDARGFRDGSDTALHPANPNAPIKAGDVIMLRTGNHGSPRILNMFNSDYITVTAAPGAEPIIGQTTIISAAKWAFSGVTFEGAVTGAIGSTSYQNKQNYLVSSGVYDWLGKTSDVVFDNDTFRTAATTNGWSKYDWYNKPYMFALFIRSPCGAVTNNHVYNAFNAIAISGPQSLVQGNTIEDFSNDGLEIMDSNLLIKNNTIRLAATNSADPIHSDGIQGWSQTVNGALQTNTNVLIDGNIISQPRDQSIVMQGISIFDGNWNGLTIQNNVVTTNHWHGIAVYGGQDSRVLNNTVISADPDGHPSWIIVRDGKDNAKATSLVRNNIATWIVSTSAGATIDHNMTSYAIQVPGKRVTSGTFGNANTITPAVLRGFLDLDTKAGTFDLRLKSTSPAVGQGVAADAPPTDVTGRTRGSSVDLGAYVQGDTTRSATVSPAPRTASSSP